jgi:hypothetical protein
MTTGTTNFNLNFAELAEEAFERASGGQRELRSGYDLRTARRSLSLMLAEWANRGINLWTVDQGSMPLVQGQATYALPADTVDLLEHVIRENGTDLNITRISVSVYATIPNKTTEGRPIQLFINRLRDAPEFTVWPVPRSNDYTLVYWRMRRLQDPGVSEDAQDVPFRFLPCLVAGLSFYLAQKIPEGMPLLQMLKMEYEEQFQRAADEDREKADVRFVPRIYR